MMQNNIQTDDLQIDVNSRDAAIGIGCGLLSTAGIITTGVHLGGMVTDHFNNEAGAALAATVMVASVILGAAAGGLSAQAIPQWCALGSGRARIKTEAEKKDSMRSIPGRDLC